MLALRHFKALCCFGVFLGGLSFLFAIVAIATTPWFVAELTEELSVTEEVGMLVEQKNGVEEFEDENTTAITNVSNNTKTTTATNVVTSTTSTTTRTVISLSGLWYICTYRKQDTGRNTECIKTLKLIEQIERNQLTYFQSLIAFELISSIATLTSCLVALAALVQQQPLAVLVAGFTMFFSGMFMLVGHLMMLGKHVSTDTESWEYGYSFKLAWTAFTLCLITGIIDFIVYRNFRKITEEMMLGTVPVSNPKYVTRSSPVNLQSSI